MSDAGDSNRKMRKPSLLSFRSTAGKPEAFPREPVAAEKGDREERARAAPSPLLLALAGREGMPERVAASPAPGASVAELVRRRKAGPFGREGEDETRFPHEAPGEPQPAPTLRLLKTTRTSAPRDKAGATPGTGMRQPAVAGKRDEPPVSGRLRGLLGRLGVGSGGRGSLKARAEVGAPAAEPVLPPQAGRDEARAPALREQPEPGGPEARHEFQSRRPETFDSPDVPPAPFAPRKPIDEVRESLRDLGEALRELNDSRSRRRRP